MHQPTQYQIATYMIVYHDDVSYHLLHYLLYIRVDDSFSFESVWLFYCSYNLEISHYSIYLSYLSFTLYS